MAKTVIACQTCAAGALKRCKKYRLSGPAVLIGYILLIPSILGVAFCSLMLTLSGGAAATIVEQAKRDAQQTLTTAGVSQDVIDAVVAYQELTQQQQDALTADQRTAVSDASLALSASTSGAGLGGVFAGGASICMGVSFFIGGLLGWLLIMKKWVLQCTNCGAVVAAS